MGWITEEYSRRSPAAQPSQDPDQARQHAIANLWLELRDGLQADVNEYNRWGGAAIFDATEQEQAAISDPTTGLQVRIQADLPDRHLRYEFEATRESVPAPDGGFFSIHIAAAGKAELFSADQPLTCEQARRVLLQPVLFPSDTSTPLRQSA
ncbi:MAG TPA: hypothetical protein VJ756_17800 [Terriglobales bacterium]|jgi:hypothetical protein|nr:hypothetical protein [Terriglobales bacterium]